MFEDYKRKARNVPEETYTKELHRIRNISEKEENYVASQHCFFFNFSFLYALLLTKSNHSLIYSPASDVL